MQTPTCRDAAYHATCRELGLYNSQQSKSVTVICRARCLIPETPEVGTPPLSNSTLEQLHLNKAHTGFHLLPLPWVKCGMAGSGKPFVDHYVRGLGPQSRPCHSSQPLDVIGKRSQEIQRTWHGGCSCKCPEHPHS